MLLLTFVSLFGSFFTTLFTASIRKVQFSQRNAPAFFYQRFQKLFFQKKEAERIFFALKVSKFTLLFLFVYSLTSLTIIKMIGTLLGSLIIIEVFPALMGYKFHESAFRFAAPITSLFLIILSPLHFALAFFLRRFLDALTFHPAKQLSGGVAEKVMAILEGSESKSSHDKKLIHSALAFKDRIVREVMVPRVHLFALPIKTTVKEAADLLLREGYSRVPVYRESIDEILGLLMHKDILKLFVEAKSEADLHKLEKTSLEGLIKPVLFTPETKKVAALLQDFRLKQMHMAVVVDEYGGTEGLITIEDLLEEIVGEIADEYDEEQEKLYTAESEGSFLVDPRMSILDVEEHCGITIPQEGEYDTVGGYILHKAGAIPKKGFHISHNTFDLEVLNATERAIIKVRIKKRSPLDEEE